jgi:hypothetical protein
LIQNELSCDGDLSFVTRSCCLFPWSQSYPSSLCSWRTPHIYKRYDLESWIWPKFWFAYLALTPGSSISDQFHKWTLNLFLQQRYYLHSLIQRNFFLRFFSV